MTLLELCRNCNWRQLLFRWDWCVVGVALLLIAFAFVVWRTSCMCGTPIVEDHGYGLAYRTGDFTTIEYTRRFTVTENFTGNVSRSVECEGWRSFDVPAITRKFVKGTHETNRTFAVAYRYPRDVECTMRTWVTWHPFGSLREHTFEVQPMHFKVIGVKD